MIFIVYSAAGHDLIETRLGKSEHTYYFVLEAFLPVLEQLGSIRKVTDPEREVDFIYRDAVQRGEPCIFLSFTPPHETPLHLACPTIPVFSWHCETIPNETWFNERHQDWRYVLNKLGKAITHSTCATSAVKRAMGEDFLIANIPAPIWDRFGALRTRRPTALRAPGTTLDLAGTVIDSRHFDYSVYARSSTGESAPPPMVEDVKAPVRLLLDGVVYLSIFNPYHWRKNWSDLLAGFCWAFRDVEDATLVCKCTYIHDECSIAMSWLLGHLHRLTPFRCRILLLCGFLDSDRYEALVTAATYAVNTAKGEGQCLPLMEAMACGKPAIAPRHSGMADYVDSSNSFVVRSSAEPAEWPHDPRRAYRTMQHRIDFQLLVEAFGQSYGVAKSEPERYAAMAAAASETVGRHCSRARTIDRLQELLMAPPRRPEPDHRFGRIKPHVVAPWLGGLSVV